MLITGQIAMNNSTVFDQEFIDNDDAAWVLTCSFLILTMQTGFAMLECGCVSEKSMANIMVKNVVDVTVGGVAYWMFGYALSFGYLSTPFCGYSDFFYYPKELDSIGSKYSKYFFQFSFATTATTIVSGAVAERMKLYAYMAFSFLNTFVYCIPASWVWNHNGFLRSLHFYDFAGAAVVHLSGGMSALVCTTMLGPRQDRFTDKDHYQMNSPVTALTGMFMLYWAWLGFNCGSTFGVSKNLWKVTTLTAVTTLNGSIGGSLVGLASSMTLNKGKVKIGCIINSLLGGLVSVTGISSVTTPLDALIIGGIGAAFAVSSVPIINYMKIDDPVGAIPVHLVAGLWGTIAVGLFSHSNIITLQESGVIYGGHWWALVVQLIGVLCIVSWSCVTTVLIMFFIDKTVGIRLSKEDELLGADWAEHDIRMPTVYIKLDKPFCENAEKILDAMSSQGIDLKGLIPGISHEANTGTNRPNKVELVIKQEKIKPDRREPSIAWQENYIENVAVDLL